MGVGLLDEFEARNLLWGLAWVCHSSCIPADANAQDLVAYKGGCVFDFEGKSVAVISARFGRTDLFE